MGNYSKIIEDIQNNIRQNGNQEITGNLLGGILKTIIEEIGKGWVFGGIVTPESTLSPSDSKVMYLATTNGTYVDGIVVSDEMKLIFEQNGRFYTRNTFIPIMPFVVQGLGMYTANSENTMEAEGYAFGARHTIMEENGFAEGNGNIVYLNAHGEGENNGAKGRASHAEGMQNVTTGEASHVEGVQNNSAGNFSHVEGTDQEESGERNHLEGSEHIVAGTYNHVEGVANQVEGDNNHIIGISNIIKGYLNFVMGDSNRTENDESVIFGETNISEGDRNIILGVNNEATGNRNILIGDDLLAVGNDIVLLGHWNETNPNIAFAVANGDDDRNRKNLFEIHKNGDIYIRFKDEKICLQDYLNK